MHTILIIAFVILWFYSGYKSFVYWWTKDFDFTTNDIGTAIFAGLVGPLAYLMGMNIHGKKKNP